MEQERKKLIITIVALVVLIGIVSVFGRPAAPRKENVSAIGTEQTATSSFTGNEKAREEDETEAMAESAGSGEETSEASVRSIGGNLTVEDITEQVRREQLKDPVSEYVNEGLGLQFEYPADWNINESSVPGQFTVRIAKELNTNEAAIVDFRYYRAVVDTDSAITKYVAGMAAYSGGSGAWRELLIPLEDEARTGMGEWSGRVLSVRYGVFKTADGTPSDNIAAFNRTYDDFQTVLDSLNMK